MVREDMFYRFKKRYVFENQNPRATINAKMFFENWPYSV